MGPLKLFSFLFFQIAVIAIANAQADIAKAFNAIAASPQIIHLKAGNIKIPSGGHLQGIQALSDSEFVMTGSSSSYSYYLIANKTQVKSIGKLSDAPYRHAGGCQVVGTELAAGLEDNEAKDKSEVMLIPMLDSVSRKERNILIRRAGKYKRSTAGAVGYTHTAKHFIFAVGAWDSRDIDFYRCPVDYPKVDSFSTFHAPDSASWCSYQSINLLTDIWDRTYLIGFGLDGVRNRADLFQVMFKPDGAELKLISSRSFACKGGAGFRYGAGIGAGEDGKLMIYACSRNPKGRITVNLFR